MSLSMEEARKAMIAKRFGGKKEGASGGAGTARRKKVTKAKVTNPDDKRIAGNLKRLNLQTLPDIEEVNLFKDTDEVVHFVKPRVQASVQSKTFVISGNCETTTVQALMPGILTQMGNLEQLEKAAAAVAAAAGAGDESGPPELVEADDEDEMPELVEES